MRRLHNFLIWLDHQTRGSHSVDSCHDKDQRGEATASITIARTNTGRVTTSKRKAQ